MRYDAAGRDRLTPDPLLTQISIEFENQTDYIAGRLFPKVRVTDKSGRYEIFGPSHFRRHFGGTRRAPGARANETSGKRAFAEDAYYAVEHALEELTPDEENEEAPAGANPEGEAVEALTADLLLGKELRVRDLLYDATVYHTSHVRTLGAGEQFDDYATSDPIGVFRTIMRQFHKSVGILPNVAVFPWRVMSYLVDHPQMIERYALRGGVITPAMVAEALGLREIIVPGTNYDSSNPGQNVALTDIWGSDNIVLGIVPPRPARGVPALGYEFLHPIPGGGRRSGDDVQVDRRRDGDRIGWINRVRRRYDLKLVGKDPDAVGNPLISGYLVRNVLLDNA